MSSNFSDTRLLKKTGPDTCGQTDRHLPMLHFEKFIRTKRGTHQRNFPVRHHCWHKLVFPSLIDDVPDLTLGDKSNALR